MGSLIVSVVALGVSTGCLVYNVYLYHKTTGKWF